MVEDLALLFSKDLFTSDQMSKLSVQFCIPTAFLEFLLKPATGQNYRYRSEASFKDAQFFTPASLFLAAAIDYDDKWRQMVEDF